MSLNIKEIKVKSILTKTGIPGIDYCINPYVGCSHGCIYCYATFMKRYTGHTEEWGSFVDVKSNAPEVLQRQLKKMTQAGNIIISSVIDPYQPVEAKHRQ
jgi:DNA repair photolyase